MLFSLTGFTQANTFEKKTHSQGMSGGWDMLHRYNRCWPVIRASSSFQSRHCCVYHIILLYDITPTVSKTVYIPIYARIV